MSYRTTVLSALEQDDQGMGSESTELQKEAAGEEGRGREEFNGCSNCRGGGGGGGFFLESSSKHETEVCGAGAAHEHGKEVEAASFVRADIVVSSSFCAADEEWERRRRESREMEMRQMGNKYGEAQGEEGRREWERRRWEREQKEVCSAEREWESRRREREQKEGCSAEESDDGRAPEEEKEEEEMVRVEECVKATAGVDTPAHTGLGSRDESHDTYERSRDTGSRDTGRSRDFERELRRQGSAQGREEESCGAERSRDSDRSRVSQDGAQGREEEAELLRTRWVVVICARTHTHTNTCMHTGADTDTQTHRHRHRNRHRHRRRHRHRH